MCGSQLFHVLRATIPSLTEPATTQGIRLDGIGHRDPCQLALFRGSHSDFHLQESLALRPCMVPAVSLAGGHQGQCKMYRPLILAEVCKHRYEAVAGRGSCWRQLKALGRLPPGVPKPVELSLMFSASGDTEAQSKPGTKMSPRDLAPRPDLCPRSS